MNPVGSGDVVIEMEELPPMPAPQKVGCWGRTFQDWSQYIIAPATIAVGASAVISWISNDLPPAIIDTAATVALVVAFVRLRALKPRKELEDEVNFFKDRIVDLLKQNNRLGKNINALNKTKNLIRKQVGEAKVAVSELGKILDTKDFEALSNRMGITLKKVQKIALNYTLFNNAFKALSNEVARYEAIRKRIADTVKELSGEVIKLGENESDLSSEVDELEENVDEIEENRENLRKQFEEFETFGKEVQGDVGELKLNVDKLETTITMIEETPHRLDEEFRKLNQSVAELWKLVEKGEEVFGKKEGPNSNNE